MTTIRTDDPALDDALARISDLAGRLWAVRQAHSPVATRDEPGRPRFGRGRFGRGLNGRGRFGRERAAAERAAGWGTTQWFETTVDDVGQVLFALAVGVADPLQQQIGE